MLINFQVISACTDSNKHEACDCTSVTIIKFIVAPISDYFMKVLKLHPGIDN